MSKAKKNKIKKHTHKKPSYKDSSLPKVLDWSEIRDIVSESLDFFDDADYDRAKNLASDLVKICRKERALGLAAPQIGQNFRLFVTVRQGSDMLKIYANPSYEPIVENKIDSIEGCLSVKGMNFNVKRHPRIEVTYVDIYKKDIVVEVLDGQDAIVFQHEYDHLEGISLPQKNNA